MKQVSRRGFIQTGVVGLAAATGAEGLASDEKMSAPTISGIENEIKRRAALHLSQRRLVVDYYRIRRKLAYPLPLTDLYVPEVIVPSIKTYPWATWLLWALEERIFSLGWAAQWFNDTEAGLAAARDLEALCGWKTFRQYTTPGLCCGHVGRLLWTVLTQWTWLNNDLREHLTTTCARHFEEVWGDIEKYYSDLRTPQDFLSQLQPHKKLHNIPFIGTIGAALTGTIAKHPKTKEAHMLVHGIYGAVLESQKNGFTEGVCYDGYVLDFMSDWLNVAPSNMRKDIITHPTLKHALEESYMLPVPGAQADVAPLSDVEPVEMPYHLSAQAKLQHHQPDTLRMWHLKRCPFERYPAAGLAALRPVYNDKVSDAPVAGALNAHYARVLRSGWEDEELAVALSCATSPMSHLQKDNGTLLIGCRGKWLIDDLGYQQYVNGDERTFTLSATAHNYPVINGLGQVRKAAQCLFLGQTAPGVYSTRVDLTACYPDDVQAKSITRTVWLANKDRVIVADEIKASGMKTLQYHWHGHPSASWFIKDAHALVHTPEADLWFTSTQANIAETGLYYLDGSRGQLTFISEAQTNAPVLWWAFTLGDKPKALSIAKDVRSLTVDGDTYKV